MKLKYNFVIREVAGKSVAVAVGQDSVAFNGMVKLNDTAKFIFEKMNSGETTEADLIEQVKNQYNVEESLAREAVVGFVGSLRANGLITE